MEDLPLNRPTPRLHPPPPPRQSSVLRWILVAIAGVAVGGALTFWWMSRTQPAPAPLPSADVADVDTSSNRPKRQPIDLPALSASDALLRSLVGTLSQHPTLARFLATDGIVRGAALAVVQIGDGRTPSAPLASLRPSVHAQITGATSGTVPAANYTRWEPVASALTSIRPADAAQLYVNVKPLADEAYNELGHTGGNFDDALIRAIQVLRETPAPSATPTLLRRPGYLEYEDPALQALKPVQKQFLLMGPEHRRRVLAWLDELARTHDLDGSTHDPLVQRGIGATTSRRYEYRRAGFAPDGKLCDCIYLAPAVAG